MNSKTRSVLRLVQKGLIHKSVLTENPDDWPLKVSPKNAMAGHAYSGDVIFGLDSSATPRRALVLCPNDALYALRESVMDASVPGLDARISLYVRRAPIITPDGSGSFIVLWHEGARWGRRIKLLCLSNIRKAYARLGPEVCMALEARCSPDPELRMAGEAKQIPI